MDLIDRIVEATMKQFRSRMFKEQNIATGYLLKITGNLVELGEVDVTEVNILLLLTLLARKNFQM
ncbi:hypothetical protein J6590_038445 [Homalodisca vitripennis]|nr:hypothetical protein J6590_038445 [Homalodisca vitripennis]